MDHNRRTKYICTPLCHLQKAFRIIVLLAIVYIAGSSAGFAEIATNRYALVLEDPPVASQFQSREAVQSAAGRSYHQQIQARQRAIRTELATRNIQVTGSVDTLQNAIFVVATPRPRSRTEEPARG